MQITTGDSTNDTLNYFTSDNSNYRVTNGEPEKIDDPESTENPKSKIDNPDFVSSGEVPLTVDKVAIAPTVSITGWTYGSTANDPGVTGNTGNGTVTYSYKVKDA